jgi:hypothetical protein
MWSSESFCLAIARANESAWKRLLRAVIGLQDLAEHRTPPRLFGFSRNLRKRRRSCLLDGHLFRFRPGQQVAR